MDTNDTPAGGSRWEPAPPEGAQHPAGWSAQPIDGTTTETPPAPSSARAESKPGAVTRGKLALVAGAVGLVAAGGIGGFVLGQSSSANAGTSTNQMGTRPGFGGGEGGFPGRQAPGGQVPGGSISGGTGTGTGSSTGTDPTT